GDDAAKGIFGLDGDDIAGIDRQNRFCVRSIDIVERTLLLDREFMALSGLALGHAARCHDRGLEPGIVGHCGFLISSQRRMAAMPVGDALIRITSSDQARLVKVAANELKRGPATACYKSARKSYRRTSGHIEGTAKAQETRDQFRILTQCCHLGKGRRGKRLSR